MPISTISEKLQQTADELGEQPETLSIPFVYVEGMKLKLRNIQVKQTLQSGANSFILGHPVNGRLGVAIAMGGGQIVLGQSGTTTVIDIVKRSYEWKTPEDFQRGNVSSNVDVSQGFLQLGNVAVKNILLEHKTK